MGSKTAIILLWSLLIGLTDGTPEVNMTGSWKAKVGWEMTCMWSLSRMLQSVRLYNNDAQFFIFRPEKQGRNYSSTFEPSTGHLRMTVDCYDLGFTGLCGITLELLSPPMFDAKYKCEVSEEAPKFEIKYAEYVQEVFVPPTYPHLVVSAVNGRTEVNCTSEGIPAPRLLWRIGDQRIQETFSDRKWNFSTKLWLSWSIVSVLQPSNLPVTCTAISAKAGRTVEEQAVEIYLNSASHFKGEKTLLAILSLIGLLR